MAAPEIHWAPIIAAAAGYWILGELWYSKPVLRRIWSRWVPDLACHVRRDVRAQLVSVVYAGVMSWLTAVVIAAAGVEKLPVGVLIGVAVLAGTKLFSSLTYARTEAVGHAVWWIHLACQLTGFAGMGCLLTAWR